MPSYEVEDVAVVLMDRKNPSETSQKKMSLPAVKKPVSPANEGKSFAPLVGPIWMDTKEFRKQRGESQFEFWDRFGVTQSAGSRYEVDSRSTPRSVLMLIIAFALGVISEDELERLNEASKDVD